MSPSKYEDWLEVAKHRALEAEAIYKNHPESVGAIYMAGYAVECSLKALLQKQGKPLPRSGRQGHNLRDLWKSSGFKFADICDSSGSKTFFIKDWDTSLRYEIALSLEHGLKVKDLLEGAKNLSGWLETQTRRYRRRR